MLHTVCDTFIVIVDVVVVVVVVVSMYVSSKEAVVRFPI